MPVDIDYLDKGAGVLIVGKGIITLADMQGFYDRIYSSEDKIKRIKYRLNDYLHIEGVHITPEEIQLLAQDYKTIAEINPDSILALAVRIDAGFGICRMWEAYVDESPAYTMTFRSRAEAEEWIREQVRIRFGMDVSL